MDRAHGHGLFLPNLVGDAVTSSASKMLNASPTTGGSAHTKGAWSQVVAATSAPAHGIILVPFGANYANVTDTSTLVDVGIGGAGSEVVIVPNVATGYASGSQTSPIVLPVYVPQGSRIAVRAQSTRTSQAVSLGVALIRTQVTRLPSPTALVNIGANTAMSRGVDLTAPGSTNTKAAWTEVTSSAPMALQALAVCLQGAAGTTFTASEFLLDIAVGASGAETVVIPNFYGQCSSSEAVITGSVPSLWPVNIPAGARIAARYQRSANSTLDITLIGVPA